MIDSTPLLRSHSSSVEGADEASVQRWFSMQLVQSIVVAAAWFFDGQQTFISVFTDADPKWKCLDPVDPICNSASSPCALQPESWAWESFDTSIVSEWSLQCTDTILPSIPASAFFTGCVVGALFMSTLADSVLGRKLLLILSCLVMSLGGTMTVLSPNVWVYSAFKFISGLGRASIGSSALVLSVALNGLSELPASLLTLLLVATMDRRTTVLILTAVSALCSLACVFDTVGIANKIQLAAEVISYCAACTAINVMLIYCVELFPTTIRNTAISLVRETTLLAGAFAPVMAVEGKSNRLWSFGFFGLAIGFCSLPFAFLPDTKGKDLVDKIQDDEDI